MISSEKWVTIQNGSFPFSKPKASQQCGKLSQRITRSPFSNPEMLSPTILLPDPEVIKFNSKFLCEWILALDAKGNFLDMNECLLGTNIFSKINSMAWYIDNIGLI